MTKMTKAEIKEAFDTASQDEFTALFEKGLLGKGRKMWVRRKYERREDMPPTRDAIEMGIYNDYWNDFKPSIGADCTDCGKPVNFGLYHFRQVTKVTKTINGKRHERIFSSPGDEVKHRSNIAGYSGACDKYDRFDHLSRKAWEAGERTPCSFKLTLKCGGAAVVEKWDRYFCADHA